MSASPIDLREIDKRANNVYEAIIVAAKKSRLMNNEIREEFKQALETLPKSNQEEDGEDLNNPQQLKLSLTFEKREKPHIQALNKLLDGDIAYRYRVKKENF